MIKPEVLDALVAAGCTAEQIAAAVKADQAKATGAARQARYRAKKKALQGDDVTSRDVTGVTVTDGDAPPALDKEIPPTPPKEIKPSPIPPSPPKGGSSPTDFDAWYRHYPNKVGRGQAERAFPKALQIASLEALIEATRRYAAKTDDRPWKNPATWLNGKCWLDDPAPTPTATAPPGSANVYSLLDGIKSGKLDVGDLLNGKSHDNIPTIDASYERTDRGGSGPPVQDHALPSRR